MGSLIFILFSLISSITCYDIGVIGGGIGGGSTSYFLKRMKPNDVTIDLYESNRLGGRLSTLKWKDHSYEIGGSIIHPNNFYMKLFVEKFGLEKKKECQDTFGLFRRNQILFQSSEYSFATVWRLWKRYGFEVVRLLKAIEEVIEHFLSIYYYIDDASVYPANTTNELLALAGQDVLELLNVSTTIGLRRMGYSRQLIEELVSAILNCNYCQTPDIHFFVGSVAIAGADSDLWAVKGGNHQVAEQLVHSSTNSLLHEEVKSVEYDKINNKFIISTDLTNKAYDYVVLAAPLTYKNKIKFLGFDSQPDVENFHLTVCTLIQGYLKPEFFNMKNHTLPDTFLFTGRCKIKALARIHPVDGQCSQISDVYKIFSDANLIKKDLDLMFANYTIISATEWLAYPEYGHNAKIKSFFLFDKSVNVYYVNAVEALASAMEMSAIGGHNVAALISKDITMRKELLKKNEKNPNKITPEVRPRHQEL